MVIKAERVWKVLLLGEVEVRTDSGECVTFPGRYSKALLAYLCLEPGKTHSRELLAELLWPTKELTSKRTRLRQELSVLRRLVGVREEGGLLVIDRNSVSVVAERVETDLQSFQALLAQRTLASDEDALARLIALHRGPLLAGHDELVNGHRRAVEQGLETALWSQVQLAKGKGDTGTALGALQSLLKRDSLDLEAHAELMRLYQTQGQPGAVHRQYQEAERIWQDTLGTPLPPALTELATTLLQDLPLPVLESPRAPQVSPAVAAPSASPTRARSVWFLIPLLLIGVVGLATLTWRRQARPAQNTAQKGTRWYYRDSPGPGEKHKQQDTSSEATAVVSNTQHRLCVVGLVDTETEDIDSLALFFTPNGSLVKRHRFSGSGHDCDRAFAVAAEGSDTFYVAGESFFPEAPGQPEGWRLMLLKYDSEGNLLWARFSAERAENESRSVRVVGDGRGGAYLGGTALVSGKHQPLVLHYGPSGALLWSQTVSVPGKESKFAALGVGVDGTIFLAGNTAPTGSPSTDWLVAALSPTGQLLWQSQLDGPGHGTDHVGALQVNRFNQVFIEGTLQESPAKGSVLAVARYSATGEQQGVTLDKEAQPDLRFESAQLSSNGIRLIVTGQFSSPDGQVESRVMMVDELGNLRWKLALPPSLPDHSVAASHVLTDANGGCLVAAYVTAQRLFTLLVNGDSALLQVNPLGKLEASQRFASEDGSATEDGASDFTNAICGGEGDSAILVGQRRELGKISSLQVVALNPPRRP